MVREKNWDKEKEINEREAETSEKSIVTKRKNMQMERKGQKYYRLDGGKEKKDINCL